MTTYTCQQDRRTTLDERIYSRNLPSQSLQMQFDPRPITTRFQIMPTIDNHGPANEPIVCQPAFQSTTAFNPGTMSPYEGYASNIDSDSRIKSLFFPVQSAIRSKYIPSSQSNMYKNIIPETKNIQTYPNLSNNFSFAPFNPNTCDIGYKLLHNHTRQQVRNL